MNNPLLELDRLPAFSRIRPEHVLPAIQSLIEENRSGIQRVLSAGGPYGWGNLVEPLERLDDRLNRAWSPVSHMNSVVDSPELREAHDACLPLLTEFASEVGQNESLCQAYRTVLEQDPSLNAQQQRILQNVLRDFHLSGVDLALEHKARFKEISQELSLLTNRYQQNLLDATQAWSKRFDDPSALAGLPQTALELAAQTAQQRDEVGWMITLDFPSYPTVMTYAEDRQLRREVYEAYSTRASDQGPFAGQWDNTDLMEQILALRHEAAHLLGFANYAERSLAKKMAPTCDAVIAFLQELALHSKPQAQRELEELRQFAVDIHGLDALQPWDVGFYSEKLRLQRYELSQEEVRPYLPVTRVVPGMFAVVERLFGVQIHEVETFDRWHPDVRFFELRSSTGELRAQFYLDLYARQHKRGGAWMDECASRYFSAGIDQLPVAYLTCNFTPPVGCRPALLTHDEVQTLFHEFGHGLHHMLTRIDYPPIAGISGVAWDAVELPSQFMENFCWERQALDLLSGHFETGEAIPDDLYQRMIAARNFQSAMQMVRQLEFSLFDFLIHRQYDPQQGGRIQQTLEKVRREVAVLTPPAWNRFAHGFSHIFAGGYGAGYYSYKWAEVLSADAFSLFEEEGVFNAETGQAFMREILEKGGSADAMELFVAFRGREPSIEPLLRHNGILAGGG